MLYSQQRGDRASGFATTDLLVKEASPASFTIAKHELPKTNLLIGHTRNPSVKTGSTVENAQPFDVGKIIGGHNGYISNYHELRNKLQTPLDMSDSFHALSYINEHGIEEAYNNFYGSMAFIWIDKKTQTLNLFRDNNPTYLGQKNGNIFIASDDDYLKAIDCVNISETDPLMHYVLKNGQISKTFKITKKVKSPPTTTQRESLYGQSHIKSYHSSEITRIEAEQAPANAKSLWHEGYKLFYWQEGTNVKIEIIHSYKDTEVFCFDLKYQAAVKEGYKKFKPVFQNVLENV